VIDLQVCGHLSRWHGEGCSLVGYLYRRLGLECGAVVKRLHAAGVSWGTYADLMGTHCNAHANNMVVQIPTAAAASGRLLAPLDFDMAYTREEFIEVRECWHLSFVDADSLFLCGTESPGVHHELRSNIPGVPLPCGGCSGADRA
jgi:hypothetical protein